MLNSVLCCLNKHAMRMLYKILQDGIRRANVRGPLVMIFLLTYPRFKVIGLLYIHPCP